MSESPDPRRPSGLAIVVLLGVTLGLTLSRAMRWPNDFAEAHWLLDYRFGFVKRGLAGQVLSSVLGLGGAEPTAAIITVLSVAVLAALSVVFVWMGWQLVRAAAAPGPAALVSLAFLSSPFVVMTAHLIGYMDGIILLLSVVAVALMRRGRLWAAALAQATAILVHESAVLVGVPVLVLAWWVSASPEGQKRSLARAAPLLLPLVAFVALALSARALPPDFEDQYSRHLMQYAFVEGDMHIFVPEWLTPGFAQHFAEQKHRFAERVANGEMFGLILPTVLALLVWVVDACRLRIWSVTTALLVAATFAPQLMHVAAWDTVRIWTYSAAMAWLATWTLVSARGAPGAVSPGVRLLALGAIVSNVMVSTPLLDTLADHYLLSTRLLLFAPVLVVAARLALRSDEPPSR